MINVYKEIDEKLNFSQIDGIKEDTKIEPKTWLELSTSTEQELEILSSKTSIPLHFLQSALDEEETARIDNEAGSSLIVLDVPVVNKDDVNVYISKPFIIAYNDNFYVTVNQFNDTLVPSLFAAHKKIEPQKQVRLTLNLIYELSREFILHLKRIDAQTKDIENRLHTSMKNKELFELMDLNKTLVYFATALNANKAVLKRLLNSPRYKKYDADFDLMEDTEVELDQAIEMCSIYREILAGMMDANASIISNNLNIVMKTLAVITIVISIPTLIASFFGMNFQDPAHPLVQSPEFWTVIAVSVILALIGAILLFFITKKNKKD